MHRGKPQKEPWSLEDTRAERNRLKQARPEVRFDPYDGTYANKKPGRKRDLRRLQEWLEAKRRAEKQKHENELAPLERLKR